MPLRNAGYALVSLLRELAKDFQPLILRNPDFRFGFRIEAQDRLAGAVVTDERHLVARLPLPGQGGVRWHAGHIGAGSAGSRKGGFTSLLMTGCAALPVGVRTAGVRTAGAHAKNWKGAFAGDALAREELWTAWVHNLLAPEPGLGGSQLSRDQFFS